MSDYINPNPQPDLSDQDAELLSAYIDRTLSAQDQQALETRLADNAFLRAELQAMRQTVAVINALPTLKAPRNFTITAQDVADTSSADSRKTPSKIIPFNTLTALASAAALIVVVIGIAVILPSTTQQGAFSPVAGDTAQEVAQIPTAQPTSALQSAPSATTLQFNTQTTDITSATTAEDASNSARSTTEDSFAVAMPTTDQSNINPTFVPQNSALDMAEAEQEEESLESQSEQAADGVAIQSQALGDTDDDIASDFEADEADDAPNEELPNQGAGASADPQAVDESAEAESAQLVPPSVGAVAQSAEPTSASADPESRSLIPEPSNLIAQYINAMRRVVEGYRQ